MKRLGTILAGIFLAIPALLIAAAFLLPPVYTGSFLGELPEKVRLLDETEGKRIIVIGGSGAAFGVDAGLLEKEFPGYGAVNFGMYAALGTKAMLELSLPSLHEGDIVILSPEQNRQTLSDAFGADFMWQGADGAFSLLTRLDGDDWKQLAAGLPSFGAEKIRCLFAGVPEPDPVYRRASFDDRGDILPSVRPANVMAGLFDPSMPVRFVPEEADPGFAKMLNEYAQKAEEKGAEVWYRFCPVNALAVTEGDADSFCFWLEEALDFPVLGDPGESVMEAGWFFDTNFHLNSAGAQLNTRNLARALRAEQMDPSPVSIPVPVMPESYGTAAETGDDSQAEWFETVPFAEGVKVTGVREGAPDPLVVPVQAGGKPVLAIERLPYGGKCVVIQPGVRVILDGAFSDCPHLERICLTGSDPNRCQVGSGLLEGTAAVICVPEEAEAAYRRSYFWAVYADRIRGMKELP